VLSAQHSEAVTESEAGGLGTGVSEQELWRATLQEIREEKR